MKKNLLLAIFGLLTLTFITSCHKDTPQSDITIQNDTYTVLTVTLNGKTYTVPVGSSQTFTANAGTAITGGVTTSGSYGETIPWDLSSYSFPPSGTAVIPIDVPSGYFYLIVKNESAWTATQLIVNYGFTDQTSEAIAIPNDGNSYGIGYYDAYTNSTVQINLANSTSQTWPNLYLPFTTNQDFQALVN